MSLYMLQVAPSLESILFRMGAQYLLKEKINMMLDPVANFHLRNWA